MSKGKWFFQCAVNYRKYNIFQTSEYDESQGYDTKKEAVSAAIDHVTEEINRITNDLDYKSKQLTDYISELKNLKEKSK